MTDTATLQRLLTWLSPAFPVGAFAWSQGLETAIADGRIKTGSDLKAITLGARREGAHAVPLHLAGRRRQHEHRAHQVVPLAEHGGAERDHLPGERLRVPARIGQGGREPGHGDPAGSNGSAGHVPTVAWMPGERQADCARDIRRLRAGAGPLFTCRTYAPV